MRSGDPAAPSRTGLVAFLRVSTIDAGGVRKSLGNVGFTVPAVADFLK